MAHFEGFGEETLAMRNERQARISDVKTQVGDMVAGFRQDSADRHASWQGVLDIMGRGARAAPAPAPTAAPAPIVQEAPEEEPAAEAPKPKKKKKKTRKARATTGKKKTTRKRTKK